MNCPDLNLLLSEILPRAKEQSITKAAEEKAQMKNRVEKFSEYDIIWIGYFKKD